MQKQRLFIYRVFQGDSTMKSWHLSLILFMASFAITALFWTLGLPFFFVFLFIPLIPLLWQPQKVRRCPVCGWETTGGERFCPWDATPLAEAGGEVGKCKE
jgi:hypothetical protein